MNISQFVTDLENLGVHLWEDSGQLRFRAPGGVLTGARRDLLREHKPAVLAHLRRLTETQALTPDTAARHEPFPLTDVQASYLLGRSDAYPCGGVACTAYLEIRFDPFDPGLAERAWRQLVGRHDALRTVVHADGYQRVLPRVPDYRIAVTDLRGAAAGTVDEAVLATREEMVSAEFAPDRWPLFDLRATWCDAHTVVHLSVDMLIGDYASVHLLVAELDQLCHDPDRRLPPLTVGFRDYVLAERALDHSGRRQRDRDYWWSRLGDLSSETSETPETLGTPEVPALPPRPGLPTVDGTSPLRRFRRIQTRLSARESSGIRSRAGAHGVTTSGALLAAYAETIARWSGQRRFTLNLPMFNRLPLHPQVDRLVGDFTSVTLLAVDHAATDSFASRATAIQAQLWRDLDHRGCSGVEVLRELARRRGRDASLMPVVFTSTLGLPDAVPDADAGDDRPGARHGEIVFGCSRTPQVWIDCQVMEDRGALVVGWDVREGLLPPGLADDAFGAFCSLVGDLAGSDAAWERSAGVRLPPAQLAARRRANDTAAPLPDRLLHSDIVAQAISTPDRTAVVDATRVLTYRELLTEANAVATELRATGDPTGDPAGTVVAVLMDKGWEQVVAVLGVLLAGAAYLPIDPAGPPSRTNAMLTDAGVRTVLTQPWTVADLPDRDVVRVRAGGSTDTGARTPATPASTGRTVDPDDLAYVIYTSGSTGRPNGVMISHRAARNTIDDINRRFGVNGDDRVLGLSGLSFDLSVYDIAGPLSRGGCLVLPTGHRRQDASYWAELIDRHGVTVWNSVPAQMQMLRYYLDSEPSVDLPSLRLALLSGDRIPTSLARRVAARLPGVSLVGLGGATEASIWSIVHPIGPDAAGRAAVPYGTPLTNQSFHVLDAELRDCPDWTPGELHIGGAGLAIGYLGDEPKTARRFIRHPVTGQRLYRTGDVGRYRDDGVIEILGRVDDQVKIRGYRVELAEVEAALGSHPAVAAAVVLADGDRLVSFAVPASRPHTAPGRIPEVPEVPDQPNREADRADDAGAVAAAAGAAGAMATAGIDGELLASFLERADGVALDAIVCTLRAAGLFAVSTATHDLDEITAALGADPRHRRVLRRWVSALTGAGRLVGEAGGRYRGLDTVEPAALARRWDDLADTERTLGYGADLLALIRTSSAQLAELLRCERDPLDLLFPQGTWSVAEGVYRDNLVSQCLNQAVVAGLRAIAERTGDRPLRVLEVGAGVGGTSTVLVPALAEFPVDYLFTDVSPFFTTQAAGRLGRYPWVRYGLFDINADPRAQGLLPNSFDVLVCQNVLHNARDAAVVLGRLRELLAPGGWLVIVETTVERHPLLVSMDFVDGLAAGFDDVRGDADRTFLSRDQWLDLLTAAGAETALCYPEPHEALALAGQHVFLARVKVDRAPVTSAELVAHAAARLPEHMVPAQVQVLDALPLTPNAKVDRELLRGWLPARAEARPGAAPADEPRDDLERRVAEVWMRVLDCPRVGRNDNFFTLGGDSLLVARLVGQLREREPRAAQTDWESLLRQMLLSPTVAGLAAFLRSAPPAPDLADTGGNTGGDADAGAGADADPTPVTFTRAGAGPVRVLVHDGSGTLLPYQALLDEMARRPAAGPVLGVEAGPVDRYLHVDPAVLVERLAANHTRSLLAGGDDRFHVVGYCMGGLIATEVARMLTESGARVDGLTVISCYRPSFLVEEELVAEYAFALSLGVAPARLGYPCDDTLFGRAIDVVLAETPDRIPAGRIAELADDRGPHADLTEVGRCFQDLADRPQPDRLAALARAMPDSASAPRPEDLTRLYRVFRHSLSAVTRHRAEPYAGDITFLRHSGRYGFLPGLRENMGNYWREVCLGDLTVVDIPGDHFTCLSQPHAAGVYDLLPGGDR